ncbi:MAG: hypothetical protein PHN88_07940 [Ignavibacteria bacterium]|nr:hypothetical protein [Ignavibacteria bacterium]
MKRICILFLSLLLYSLSYGQIASPKFQLSNSAGFGFKESRPAFYVGVSTEISKDFFLGIKGGIYGYDENRLDRIYDEINKVYSGLSAGTYIFGFSGFPVQHSTYVAALYGTYNLSNKLSLDASFGVKYYRDFRYYNFDVFFSKPSGSTVLNKSDLTIDDTYMSLLKKDILRPYYSLGVNYRIKSYSIGIFADNIISLGLNLGKEF